jgi:hypothetical protein
MTKLVNQINTLFSSAVDGTIYPAYNSTNSVILQEHRAELVFRRNLFAPDSSTVALRETTMVFGQKRSLHSLNVGYLKEIAGRIDTMYMTTGDYRRVLTDQNWRALFQVSQRSIRYVHGVTATKNDEDTMPCYQCGIVLPVSHITVDHAKPQSGGEDQALLKNLRNIGHGLTHAPGKGGVATAFRTGQFDALPTKSGDMQVLGNDEGRPERYTLTDKGITFLSAAVAASSLQRVKDMCMHSLFNLKPHCAKCNIAKSNRLPDLDWINN